MVDYWKESDTCIKKYKFWKVFPRSRINFIRGKARAQSAQAVSCRSYTASAFAITTPAVSFVRRLSVFSCKIIATSLWILFL